MDPFIPWSINSLISICISGCICINSSIDQSIWQRRVRGTSYHPPCYRPGTAPPCTLSPGPLIPFVHWFTDQWTVVYCCAASWVDCCLCFVAEGIRTLCNAFTNRPIDKNDHDPLWKSQMDLEIERQLTSFQSLFVLQDLVVNSRGITQGYQRISLFTGFVMGRITLTKLV